MNSAFMLLMKRESFDIGLNNPYYSVKERSWGMEIEFDLRESAPTVAASVSAFLDRYLRGCWDGSGPKEFSIGPFPAGFINPHGLYQLSRIISATKTPVYYVRDNSFPEDEVSSNYSGFIEYECEELCDEWNSNPDGCIESCEAYFECDERGNHLHYRPAKAESQYSKIWERTYFIMRDLTLLLPMLVSAHGNGQVRRCAWYWADPMKLEINVFDTAESIILYRKGRDYNLVTFNRNRKKVLTLEHRLFEGYPWQGVLFGDIIDKLVFETEIEYLIKPLDRSATDAVAIAVSNLRLFDVIYYGYLPDREYDTVFGKMKPVEFLKFARDNLSLSNFSALIADMYIKGQHMHWQDFIKFYEENFDV